MKNWREVQEELMGLVGQELQEDMIIQCFGDFEEADKKDVILSKAEGITTNLDGYGTCQLWQAYVDAANSTNFDLWIKDGVIVDVD